jgi:glutathione synthase/RimK-type ligase-like ATP-grasp enzyme
MSNRVLFTYANRPPAYSIALALTRSGLISESYAGFAVELGKGKVRSRILSECFYLPVPKNRSDSPADQDTDYVSRIMDICRLKHINIVWPCSDDEIRAISTHKTKLQNAGIHCVVNEPEVALPALDKSFVNKVAHEAGFPAPVIWKGATLSGDMLRDGFAYPVIVKANSSYGSTGVRKVHDEQELRREASQIEAQHGTIHVEEYIQGNTEISINAIRFESGVLGCCFGLRKFRYMHPSWSTSCEIVQLSDEVVALTRRFLDALGVVGFVAIQTKTDSVTGEMKLIELNQRFGGISRVLIRMVPGICQMTLASFSEKTGEALDIPYGRFGVSPFDDIGAFFVYCGQNSRGVVSDDNPRPSLFRMLRSYAHVYSKLPFLDDYTRALWDDPAFALGFMPKMMKHESKLPENWKNLIPWGQVS